MEFLENLSTEPAPHRLHHQVPRTTHVGSALLLTSSLHKHNHKLRKEKHNPSASPSTKQALRANRVKPR